MSAFLCQITAPTPWLCHEQYLYMFGHMDDLIEREEDVACAFHRSHVERRNGGRGQPREPDAADAGLTKVISDTLHGYLMELTKHE